ncbi:hypothetical protein C8A03DRAFT_37787 [Achaetomium macrosporum]|uniref:Cyanovirin-N domain-containing protein n=1 Tax=Achaetomium macrosporum TaxID=79813 RepID=A0AAN7HB23_9PEZI|nr:hypothetical protein C8A03DRAFT_37787 [Achaetomium macrosporum]
MKSTVILSLISLCAAAALDAVPRDAEAVARDAENLPRVVGVTPRGFEAFPRDANAVAGGFGATCWDFAFDHTYLYATCSSGGAGSPAIRSAVDLNTRITNRNGYLSFDC